jgi:hypothetical protein
MLKIRRSPGQKVQSRGGTPALRAPRNRWLESLWHCLTRGLAYDEAIHVADRSLALGQATATAA